MRTARGRPERPGGSGTGHRERYGGGTIRWAERARQREKQR